MPEDSKPRQRKVHEAQAVSKASIGMGIDADIFERVERIASSVPKTQEPSQPDLDPAQNLESIEEEYYKKSLEQSHKELTDLHDLRKAYSFWLFILIVSWLIAVVVFVFLAGIQFEDRSNWKDFVLSFHFELSDSVLIAFITSTTVSVLGLFVIVAKWLYAIERCDCAKGKLKNKIS